MPPAPRPPISLRLLRLAAALLETGLLITMGAMLLEGSIQNPDADGPPSLPIRPGWGLVPIAAVAFAHGWQRFVRPRRFAFAIAGAIVGALGGALRPDIGIGERFRDALVGALVGAIMMGVMMSVDDESAALMEGGAQPWRELLFGALLSMIGALPAGIWGGFVLAMPSIGVGLVILGRCAWYDARVAVPKRSAAALLRVFLALFLALLGLGLLVVSPGMSLGLLRLH